MIGSDSIAIFVHSEQLLRSGFLTQCRVDRETLLILNKVGGFDL